MNRQVTLSKVSKALFAEIFLFSLYSVFMKKKSHN